MAHCPGSWDSWTPGPWLSEFDGIIIFFLIISFEGRGELTYEYFFNMSEAKSSLFAVSLENDLLSTLLNDRCFTGTSTICFYLLLLVAFHRWRTEAREVVHSHTWFPAGLGSGLAETAL